MLELTRSPYQPAQTSMERHIVSLVDHLENGRDSRGGFNQAIEAAQSHAFYLEKTILEMRAEIRKLEDALMPTLPSVKCFSEEINTTDPRGWALGGGIQFEWWMEAIRFRGMWNGGNAHRSIDKHMKRRTYREILRRFRAEFEKTWALNQPKRRAA